jgi:signal transduction histidine kinase
MLIQRKLQIVFAVLALVLVSLFLLLDQSRLRQVERSQWVTHTEEVLASLASLDAGAIEADMAVREYVMGGDPRYLESHRHALASLERHTESVARLTADDPDQARRVLGLRDAARNQVGAWRRLIELRNERGPAAAPRAFAGGGTRREIEEVHARIAEMGDEQRALLARRKEQLRASNSALLLASATSGGLVLGLLALAYLLFSRDAAHRASLELKLQQKNVELEDASRLKSEFLTNMSHELRSPLNGIMGYTGMLLMKLPGPLTADQDMQLRVVQGSARHLLSLINDLLDLAKIESGKVDVNLETLFCQEVVEQVVSTLRPLAQAKSIDLEARFPAAPVRAKTDRRAFSQILINLTNNAIKFTEKGSVRLELCERSDAGSCVAAVEVIDTGVGVPPEDQPRLFHAFEQLNSGKSQAEGTGLGLYVSVRLAALIGGRIHFQSEYGKGSRFTVLIPKA